MEAGRSVRQRVVLQFAPFLDRYLEHVREYAARGSAIGPAPIGEY